MTETPAPTVQQQEVITTSQSRESIIARLERAQGKVDAVYNALRGREDMDVERCDALIARCDIDALLFDIKYNGEMGDDQ